MILEFCFFSTAFFVLLLRCPEIFISGYLNVSTELSSRTVARKVFSPLQSLTSVFGMGTGGPSAFVAPTPTFFEKKVGKETLNRLRFFVSSSKYSSLKIEQQSIPFKNLRQSFVFSSSNYIIPISPYYTFSIERR